MDTKLIKSHSGIFIAASAMEVIFSKDEPFIEKRDREIIR